MCVCVEAVRSPASGFLYRSAGMFVFILFIQHIPRCNVQLADEIMLISIVSLIFIFAYAPVLSNMIYTKHAQ